MIISSITPFVAFWILILVGRSELGLKGVLSCVAIWVGLFLGFMYLDLSSYFFVAAQALLDVVIVLIIFGADTRIR